MRRENSYAVEELRLSRFHKKIDQRGVFCDGHPALDMRRHFSGKILSHEIHVGCGIFDVTALEATTVE
jgi:hypothetical protein